MSRFYVRPERVKGSRIYVDKEESHHIIDVMRLREGDSITAFDGTGKEYAGTIHSIKDKEVIIDVSKINIADKRRSVSIALAQSIPKKDKMDLIVQKATELGIDEIFPVESSRTVVRPRDERKRHKIERWQKIAVEASKQCGRTELPKIRDIVRFDAVLDFISKYDLAIMPCLSERAVAFKEALKNLNRPEKILVIIGPEGGFSKEEIASAGAKGSVLVSLGNLVLKSDTAAIAALSILNHEFAR